MLVATATGLVIAVPAFLVFYFLRNRLQGGMGVLQEVVSALFRKMPYDHLKGAHVGEEEFYAAVPNWVAGGGEHPRHLRQPEFDLLVFNERGRWPQNHRSPFISHFLNH
ncbi:MAG: hypothetical protein IPK32_23295 [Verrucomicrobiaceae bacterium]|nr:hypothetical protein [Verrucomicrobiaceae bacterium]